MIKSYRKSSSVTHSKESALSERQFELLLEGASTLSNSSYYYTPDPEFVIYTLGRLGLRRGELCHMCESWIDWRRSMISIPSFENCSCGYCSQLAKQKSSVRSNCTESEAMDEMWSPKTAAASRDVYFGFDPRAEMYLERYFDSEEYSSFQGSSTAVSRRVKKCAELADGLDKDDIHPHSLRATAATYHASRGLEMLPLMQFMGWAQPSTAEVYISRNGDNTARQLDSLHR